MEGKRLGTIFNSDINNILVACGGEATTPESYQRAVYAILNMRPGVVAQNVGMPDPVIYRTEVATTWDKYHKQVTELVWPETKPEVAGQQSAAMRRLLEAGTDPLTLTIEACRQRGTPIVASYRMNAEDFYHGTTLMSDFERAHPEWKIPGADCLDPAVPEVYAHRMDIFREVAERYDIDGIEFDFRRWYHMVSNPLKNHGVLTKMVRETREMLDQVARRKGRAKMLLGARVGPSLDSEPDPFMFPGIYYDQKPTNASCRELGLDVRTWLAEGLVDYICPSLFLASLPGMPLTAELAALAEGTEIGVYPTLWPLAAWEHGIHEMYITLEPKDRKALALYKDLLCTTALQMYEDGADGISTFNWYSHLHEAYPSLPWPEEPGSSGPGPSLVQTYIYPLLKSRAEIRGYRSQPWAAPPQE